MKQSATDFDSDLRNRPSSYLNPVRGLIAGFSERGEPLVDFAGNPLGNPVAAASTVKLGLEDARQEALLVFEDGDPAMPIVVGVLQAPTPVSKNQLRSSVEIRVDGERIALSAAKEIVLACGRASITLTAAGKVLIRGSYLLSRSSGVQRIQGGSVQIN